MGRFRPVHAKSMGSQEVWALLVAQAASWTAYRSGIKHPGIQRGFATAFEFILESQVHRCSITYVIEIPL
jgi:hypothetical protein